MLPLPIDALLGEIARELTGARALVLEAPPGAGKTTRVPWALYEAGLAGDREVVVTEPRRLAARLAARHVADERGARLGERVGYSVRFEDVSSRRTRVRYVTEGVLLRRLLDDPELAGAGAIVLDEFHERHLETDLLLALVKRLQASSRADLKLVVMSATLEADPVARYLSNCPLVRSDGRMFPVAVEHVARPDDRPLEKQVASAVRRAVGESPDGDVLVFLPGAAEIRRAARTLETLAAENNLLVLPLHGDLPIAEQARAVERAERRKVVLSTNVAESSITIDGVTAVVDSGLARVASHSPWSGLGALEIAKVSRASAAQRAGRAGRTRAGHVFRLYTEGDWAARREHDRPEIERADLSDALLLLHGAGVRDAAWLDWLDAPPAAALAAAESLLGALGARDEHGELTDVGQRMLALPLHPRLARLVVEGEAQGVGDGACLVAALLGERDIRLDARTSFGDARAGARGLRGPSDLSELADLFAEARDARFEPHRLRAMNLDARAVRAVERTRNKLARALAHTRAPALARARDRESALGIAVLAGFPDRVARRRRAGARDLILSSGASARLSESSVVADAMLMVAVAAEERGRSGVEVRLASAIEPEWLLDLHPDLLEMSDALEWNAESERVERTSRIACGSVVLEESCSPAPSSEEASRVLARAALARGAPSFDRDGTVERLLARLALLREHMPETGLPALESDALGRAIERAAAELTSFEELRAVDLEASLMSSLTREQQRLVREQAPERIRLPGGRELQVHYEPGKPPWVASRLQDFFGMLETPRVCAGRVPLTLELLAPNQRAVQVTRDLAGFWQRHYPSIRKELMRRYPKHAWPEDGARAKPPEPRARGR
jgi:ATP-dependent RNA helicase HrpB